MIFPDGEDCTANSMKRPSEMTVRVVMGMLMRAYCMSRKESVSRRAYRLPSMLCQSHRRTPLSFLILQDALVFSLREAVSHWIYSSGRKMKLELVVRTISLAKFEAIPREPESKASSREIPVDEHEIQLAPSRMATQTISDCLLRLFLSERSPIEIVPRFERGCKKIVATRWADSLLAKSCDSRLERYCDGLKAMAPSVNLFTPCDSFSAFMIEVFLIVMRSLSGVRNRLSPTNRMNSCALLESLAQNSANSTFCNSPATRSVEPARTTSCGWGLLCCFPKRRALTSTYLYSSAAAVFSEFSMMLQEPASPRQAGAFSQERGAVRSTATQQSTPSMKSCMWQLTSLKQHSSLQARVDPEGEAVQLQRSSLMAVRASANSLYARTQQQRRRTKRGRGVGGRGIGINCSQQCVAKRRYQVTWCISC